MHVKRPLRIHLCQFKLKNIQINKLTAIIDLRTTDSVSFESHLTKYISDWLKHTPTWGRSNVAYSIDLYLLQCIPTTQLGHNEQQLAQSEIK